MKATTQTTKATKSERFAADNNAGNELGALLDILRGDTEWYRVGNGTYVEPVTATRVN